MNADPAAGLLAGGIAELPRAEGRRVAPREGVGAVRAALFFLALTPLFLFPLPFHLSESPAALFKDHYTLLWNFWWVRKALLDPSLSLYFTPLLYSPAGGSLAFHVLSLANSLVAVPLIGTLGLVATYNLLFLATFPLAGLGMYLLARDLTGDRRAALLSGLIYAFAPYHTLRAMHINVASLHWLPFALLFLLRAVRRGGVRNAAAAAVFSALAALSDWYQLTFLLVFGILLGTWELLGLDREGPARRPLARLAGVAGLSALALLPFALPLLRELVRGGGYLYRPVPFEGETDLLGFRPQGRGELYFWGVGFGYIAMGLAVVGAWRGWRRGAALWAIGAILFFLLSLGPYPVVAAKALKGIPLPMALLREVPVVGALKVAHRFIAMLLLCLAALSAFAVASWHRGDAARGWGRFGIPALGLACALEVLAIPRPHERIPVSPFYQRLGAEEGDFAILEVPRDGFWEGVYMFYQTVHGKPLVGGYTSRTRPASLEPQKRVPALRWLAWPDRIPPPEPGELRAGLASLGVRYVVVHPRFLLSGGRGTPAEERKGWTWAFRPCVVNPSFLRAMEVPPPPPPRLVDEGALRDFLASLERSLSAPVYRDGEVWAYRVS